MNALHPIYTTKVLIQQMLARNKRSAIMITTSMAAHRPLAGVTTYCATKSMASFLAQGLSYELEGKIDCMSWQPGHVSTKMVNYKDAKGSCVTASQAVEDALRDLG